MANAEEIREERKSQHRKELVADITNGGLDFAENMRALESTEGINRIKKNILGEDVDIELVLVSLIGHINKLEREIEELKG